jgi:hypothetical protein
MFARVSFGSAGPMPPMPIPTVAGSLPNTLKNENGAALTAPRASRLVTQAIGSSDRQQHGREQQFVPLRRKHRLEIELHPHPSWDRSLLIAHSW